MIDDSYLHASHARRARSGTFRHGRQSNKDMSTFAIDPDRARLWAAELLDAADRLPDTPLPRAETSAGLDRFSASLEQALSHLDDQTRRVHDRARVLAERSHRVIDAAEGTDHTLATQLGRL